MWNRVVLLVSGFATGWFLVGYLTAPQKGARSYLASLLVSGAIGVGFSILMGVADPGSGVSALFILFLTALVAYAGSARQANKLPEEPRPGRPDRLVARDTQHTVVLLVAEGESATYDGPALWARLWQKLAAQGERAPHWLVRPWAYARIRAAYHKMGGCNPLPEALARLAQELQQQLGEKYHVQNAFLSISPTLHEALARLAGEGATRIVLLGLGFARDPVDALHEEVAASRVHEVGVDVRYAPPLEAALWPYGTLQERLRQLAAGDPPPMPIDIAPPTLQALRANILATDTV